MTTRNRTYFFLVVPTLLLAACDLPFLNDEEAKIEAKRQAEGMAVGSGCRYSSRPLEECYGMNPKTSKAAILAGWREMDAYMRENNIVVAGPETPEAAKKEGEEAPKPKAEAPAPEAPKAAAAAPQPNTPQSKEAEAQPGQKRPKRVV